jgi:hypothetical protein
MSVPSSNGSSLKPVSSPSSWSLVLVTVDLVATDLNVQIDIGELGAALASAFVLAGMADGGDTDANLVDDAAQICDFDILIFGQVLVAAAGRNAFAVGVEDG